MQLSFMQISSRTKKLVALGALLVFALLGLYRGLVQPFPSDQTPLGAYLRIARSMGAMDVNATFPYLEDEAQWACFSICDARKSAAVRIRRSYPTEAQSAALAASADLAGCSDGATAFGVLAKQYGWSGRLRRDLSGVVSSEISGERASLVTARGTRYPFRIRKNGIWGLTIFTGELVAERNRATRDLALVNAAADDYDAARTGMSTSRDGGTN
jgi:hypothetical protein